MGRRKWTTRLAVEDCLMLNIDLIMRSGFFRHPPSDHLWIEWRSGETLLAKGSLQCLSTEDSRYLLQLERPLPVARLIDRFPQKFVFQLTESRCHYGGVRRWFVCPGFQGGIPCKRRVGRLYLPPKARVFACRSCYNLTYRSRQQHNKTLDPLLHWTLPQILDALSSSEPKQIRRGWLALNEQRRRILAHPRFRAPWLEPWPPKSTSC